MSETGATVRVLHVDDDPSLGDVVVTYLEREDDRFDVRTATTPEEGRALLAEQEIHCIVSDYDMPGTDGIELLEQVREDHPDLPFILYTGKGSEEVAGDAISAGVTDYLQKEPGTSQYTVLANRIANAVDQYRARQDADATETMLHQLAEKTDDVLFLFDADWTELLFINASYADIWGGSTDALEDDPGAFLEFVHPEDRDLARRSMETLSRGEPDEIEYRIITDDGDQRWVRGESKPIFDDDGSVARIVGFVRDITGQKEREQELEEANALLSTLFETLPVAVLVENESREILAANERLFQLFDIPGTQTDVLGADCGRLAEDISDMFQDPASFVERIDELVRERESVHEEALSLQDGRTFVRSHEPIELPDGPGHLWMYRDITAQTERERRYDAVFNNTYQFTGLLEPDGTLIKANDTALEFGGLDREDVLGEPVWETHWFQHSTDVSERVRTAVERAATGEFVRDEIPVRGTDREVIIDFSVRPMTDDQGTVTHLVPEGRDITELKERERALERERDRLEEFASVVSHDLQSPLNVAEGRLELAREECDSEHLDTIGAALHRSNRIIEDVLWLAREGRDIGAIESVDVRDAVGSAWTLVAHDANCAEVRYRTDDRPLAPIEADDDRFSQLLENLLGNVIEHAGEDVTVTVGAVEGGFYVEDDGPGIPDADHEKIFEPGYSTSETGTGFGLSIVKQIAEAHGWEIRVGEGPDGGARFEFTGVEFAAE